MVLNSNRSELACSSASWILIATDACRGSVNTAKAGLLRLNLLGTPDLERMCLWEFNDSVTNDLGGVEVGSVVPAWRLCCRLRCDSEESGTQHGHRREKAKTHHIFFR